MKVESRDIRPSYRKQSAVVSSEQLAKTRGWFERILAGVVLLVSYLGTVFTIAGGVVPFLASPWEPVPWFGALLAQGLLTALQWWYRQISPWHPVYCGSLALDVAATVWGYGWVIAPPLSVWIARQGIVEAPTAAWFIVMVVSFAAAWYPEHTLVD